MSNTLSTLETMPNEILDQIFEQLVMDTKAVDITLQSRNPTTPVDATIFTPELAMLAVNKDLGAKYAKTVAEHARVAVVVNGDGGNIAPGATIPFAGADSCISINELAVYASIPDALNAFFDVLMALDCFTNLFDNSVNTFAMPRNVSFNFKAGDIPPEALLLDDDTTLFGRVCRGFQNCVSRGIHVNSPWLSTAVVRGAMRMMVVVEPGWYASFEESRGPLFFDPIRTIGGGSALVCAKRT